MPRGDSGTAGGPPPHVNDGDTEGSDEPLPFMLEEPPAEVYDHTYFRDVPYAVAFGAMVLTVGVLAANGLSTLPEWWRASTADATAPPAAPLVVLVLSPAIAVAGCWVWISLLQTLTVTKFLLRATLLAAVAFNVVGGVVLLVAFASFGGVGMLLAAAFSYWYYRMVKPRIPFAATTMAMAITALKRHPVVFPVAAALAVTQVAWVALCVAALAGFRAWLVPGAAANPQAPPPQYTGSQPEGPTPTFAVDWAPDAAVEVDSAAVNTGYFLLALAFYWGVNVLRYTVCSLSCGVVGMWWYFPHLDATRHALRRLRTAFGSVAAGALLVSVVSALRWAVSRARRVRRHDHAAAALQHSLPGRAARLLSFPGGQCGQLLSHLGSCLLAALSRAVNYATSYCWPRVMVWGEDFATAGHATMDLFRRRGWDLVLNDRLAQRILLLCAVLAGGVAPVVAAILLRFTSYTVTPEALVASGVVAASVAVCLVSVVQGGVIAVVTLFAANPDSLAAHYPELCKELATAADTAFAGPMKRSGLLRSPFMLPLMQGGQLELV